jgi:hypothetical protein
MLRKYKGHLWLTGLVSLLLLLSACSLPGQTGSTSPAQTIQNSALAMSQLKSVHFDLQANLQLSAATPAAGTSTSTGAMSFAVTGSGDGAKTGAADVNLLLNQNPFLSAVSDNGNVYVRGGDGTWYVANQNQVNGVEKFFSQDPATYLAALLGELQNATLTDQGSTTLNGQTVDHITATLDAKTLQSLASQLNGLLPANEQSAKNTLNNATLDLWVNTSNWYVVQAKFNLGANLDLSKIPQVEFNGQTINLPAEVVPANLTAQLDFSKYNVPVTVQVPTGAQPLPQ